MKLLIRVAAVVGALVICAPFLVLFDLIARMLPQHLVVIALSLFGAFAVWLWLRKRGPASLAGGESSLLGSPMSKDGLL